MHRFALASALLLGGIAPLPAASLLAPSTTPATLSTPKILLVDTALRTTAGTQLVAPKGWSLQIKGSALILGAPEGDSHVALIDVHGGDADAAVTAAWAAYQTHPVRALEAARDRPAREGWDQIRLYRYETAANEQRSVAAQALRKGDYWTVAIRDLSDAVADKRDSQLEVIFNKLWPAGYARESFAGKKAHRLNTQRLAALTEYIETGRKQLDIPGVALGLIQDGKVVFEGGFGVREIGKRTPIDAGTLFITASNGKALTTLMLAKLVEAGKFTWETPVSTLWPQFQLGNAAITRQVQVKHLICACTGLPRRDLEISFEGEKATPASTMQVLATVQPTSQFGELFQYSNLMAAAGGYLGGHMLYPQQELGAAYDKAMQTLVLDPLGMNATTLDYARALAGNHAAPHARDIDGNTVVASMGLNYAELPSRPSGAAWSNVRDMLRYVQMELANGLLPNGKRYIAENILLARREPQVTTGSDEYYGMGLKIDRMWGVPVIHHGGTMVGYSSDMIWLPEHGVGAVILTNADSGNALRTRFRRRLLEVLFDGTATAAADVASWAQQSKAGITAERKQLVIPAGRDATARLAAMYRNPALGDLVLRRERDRVVFDFGGWRTDMATRQDEDGSVVFVSISPGAQGFEFLVANQNDQRRLILRDAQHEYVFVEVK